MRIDLIAATLVLSLSALCISPVAAQEAATQPAEDAASPPAAADAVPQADEPQADEAQTDAPAETDPQARQVIEQAAEFMAGLEQLTVQVSTDITISAQGLNQTMNSKYDVAIDREQNRYAFELVEGQMGATVISDGEQLTTYLPMTGRYVVEDAPSLQELGANSAMFANDIGLSVIQLLLSDNLSQTISENSSSMQHVGEEQLEGEPAHHIRLSWDATQGLQGVLPPAGDALQSIAVDVWISAGDKPFVQRVVPELGPAMKAGMEAMDDDPQAAQMAEMMRDMQMHYEITLDDWQTDVQFEPTRFTFEPPPGAEKADSLIPDEPTAMGQGPMGSPEDLVGEEAPPFELDNLEGEAVSLDDLQGDVVILDFWATWCGPCVQAMPIVEEVAEKFADQGVKLYTVNVREQPDLIRQFLEDHDLEVNVLLDRDAMVAQQFNVTGIPQTVVIGPDGTVESVLVGFSTGLEDELTQDVEAALAQQ